VRTTACMCVGGGGCLDRAWLGPQRFSVNTATPCVFLACRLAGQINRDKNVMMQHCKLAGSASAPVGWAQARPPAPAPVQCQGKARQDKARQCRARHRVPSMASVGLPVRLPSMEGSIEGQSRALTCHRRPQAVSRHRTSAVRWSGGKKKKKGKGANGCMRVAADAARHVRHRCWRFAQSWVRP
jgi:hypothetical protein